MRERDTAPTTAFKWPGSCALVDANRRACLSSEQIAAAFVEVGDPATGTRLALTSCYQQRCGLAE
ncbi:MAG: hypothetical protein ACM3ML_03420 [Micromonosporaceae bacterium]